MVASGARSPGVACEQGEGARFCIEPGLDGEALVRQRTPEVCAPNHRESQSVREDPANPRSFADFGVEEARGHESAKRRVSYEPAQSCAGLHAEPDRLAVLDA